MNPFNGAMGSFLGGYKVGSGSQAKGSQGNPIRPIRDY